MSHLDIRPVVSGRIVSEDSQLLDAIANALPDEDSPRVGNEYSVTRETNDDGTETLSARTTFADSMQGKARAEMLFRDVTSHKLASVATDWEVNHYRSPEGGVTVDDVRTYYETNPDQLPTREIESPDDSTTTESYIPRSFDPSNHTIQTNSAQS